MKQKGTQICDKFVFIWWPWYLKTKPYILGDYYVTFQVTWKVQNVELGSGKGTGKDKHLTLTADKRPSITEIANKSKE